MLSGIQSSILRQLYQYWADRLNARTMPARADLDPADIPALLPFIILLDVERGPRRYRARLVGTHIVERFGEDITGRYIDEIDMGAGKNQIIASLDRVVDDGEPLSMAYSAEKSDGRRMSIERLVLPLSDDGRGVNMLMVGIVLMPVDRPGTGAAGSERESRLN